MKKKIMDGLITFVLLYGALVLGLYIAQRSMIYFPDRDHPTPAEYGVPQMKEVRVETDDGLTLGGWYIAPKEEGNPVILWFHGNASHHGQRAFFVATYLNLGYGVMLAGYRGYGGNPGKPTEENLYKDARAWIRGLHDAGIKTEDIVLYGESLGSGVAVQMATELPDARALVLQAPYTSLPGVAKTRYFFVPVDLLMKDKFESIKKIGDIKMPLLVMRGKKDSVIPPYIGQRLFDAAPEPKEQEIYPENGHNDLPAGKMSARVYSFLSKVPLKNQ